MNWKVLVSAPYMQPVIDEFRSTFEENDIEIIVPPVKERLSEEELLKWMIDIDGVICGDDRFTERVLRAAPRLKVISKWGTGVDSIDREACDKFGIALCNTPNAFTDPVADTVMGYITCLARQLLWTNKDMHEGKWHKLPGRSLNECTLGVIGVGNIGKAVVNRAIAFGMTVLGNDLVHMPQEFINDTGIKMVSIEKLLQESDFVSLNCDLNPSSYHLISDNEFRMMNATAYIINTARGPIIDESSLIKALTEKRIAGAALDVFEIEPLPIDSPFLKMENVLLSPHNSNSGLEAYDRVHQNTIHNLIDKLKGA
jgi:D-3-phosphoglycerate dehydrogenase